MVDHRDHNTPWWTRSVQDHLGPRSDIFLMEVRTLPRPRLKVSTLFLDIKAGFENITASILRSRLMASQVPPYMIDWVSSFLSEGTCTLAFQGSPNLPSPVSVGSSHGSSISPLLFLLYVAPLHMSVPKGLMISYVDDFSVTVSSPSHKGNIRQLQRLYSTIAKRGRDIGVSFSVPKTELIHWRTPSQRTPPSTATIKMEGQILHPSLVVSWLGYWFTPALTTTHNFRHRVALAQAIFSLIKHLSSTGAGVRPLVVQSHRPRPPATNTYLRSRPPHPGLLRAQEHEQFLAQSPKMDNEQLPLYTHLHPIPRSLPPPHHLLL